MTKDEAVAALAAYRAGKGAALSAMYGQKRIVPNNRRNIAFGNWYINRNRVNPNDFRRDLRQVSWRNLI